MRAVLLSMLLTMVALAGCSDDAPDPVDPGAPVVDSQEAKDAVVVAVLDGGFNPYHWDFLGAHMPQHLDEDPANDLPLDLAPHQWLPGFPEPSTFASYTSLDLTLTPDNETAQPSCVPSDEVACDGPGLYERDAAAWEGFKASKPDEINFHYVPGTKAIGVVSFSGTSVFSPASHGVGTSSVSVGNVHGSCPECLFVFVHNPTEAAFRWVTEQPWIDAMTNSYGAGSFQVAGLVRDNIYDGCDAQAQRLGVERGQQIFFSGGNGLANAFDAPPLTLASCQKGPDWIVTVGAITPDGESSYTGHGKPVDVASVGSGYPSAGGGTVTADKQFSGTSNAAPVTAGIYSAALKQLRDRLPGPTRMQEGGVVAAGPAGCGTANAMCALADGFVTVHEVRQALYRAATPTPGYFAEPGRDTAIPAAGSAETELWTEGHGSFMGRLGDLDGDIGRIVDYLTGDWTEQPSADETAWMTAYSYCSQQVWGSWTHGAWNETSGLPAPSQDWPYRTFMASECPQVVEAIVLAATTVGPT